MTNKLFSFLLFLFFFAWRGMWGYVRSCVVPMSRSVRRVFSRHPQTERTRICGLFVCTCSLVSDRMSLPQVADIIMSAAGDLVAHTHTHRHTHTQTHTHTDTHTHAHAHSHTRTHTHTHTHTHTNAPCVCCVCVCVCLCSRKCTFARCAEQHREMDLLFFFFFFNVFLSRFWLLSDRESKERKQRKKAEKESKERKQRKKATKRKQREKAKRKSKERKQRKKAKKESKARK